MDNYKELQILIKEYEKIKIWNYIDGTDIFKLDGFEDNVYISIMGKDGSPRGIGIYYGNQDLLSQMDISYGQYESTPDAFLRLKAYKIEIGNPKNMLMINDKKTLKENKIKPKNVVFRIDAGKFPRIVTETECLLLINILKRIINISKYIISNNINIETKFLEFMCCFGEKDGAVIYKEIKWPTLKYHFIKQKKLKESLLNKANWMKKEKEYMVGLFYAPMYLYETMTYPLMVIIYEPKEDLIIDIIVINDNKQFEIANNILEAFTNVRAIPSQIIFNSNEIADICKEIFTEFKISYRVDNNIKELFDIWFQNCEY